MIFFFFLTCFLLNTDLAEKHDIASFLILKLVKDFNVLESEGGGHALLTTITLSLKTEIFRLKHTF